MGDLDFVAKILMRAAPQAFVRLCLGNDVTVAECRAADKEIEQRTFVMDKLYELRLVGEPGPLWQHVEVAAQWRSNLPFRMLEYWVFARGRVGGPISSLLICLKPGDKQGPPRNACRELSPGTEVTHRYTLVCAWHWTVAELISGDPALIPFAPFAGDASVERIDEAIAAADQVPTRALRAELLGALAVFAENVFKDVNWTARMPKQALQ